MTVVGAFSTLSEAEQLYAIKSGELTTLKTSGQADPRERISLDNRRPSQKARSAEARLAVRKMKSGWIAQGLTKDQIGLSKFNVDNPKR